MAREEKWVSLEAEHEEMQQLPLGDWASSPTPGTDMNRLLFESSPDCVKILDLEGRLLEMNRNGRCVMEIADLAPFVGRAWRTFWPEEARRSVDAAVCAARAGGTSRFSAFCPTARGTEKWWDVTVNPVLDGHGRVTSILSVSRDITALQEATERAIRSANEARAERQRLDALLDATPVGIAYADASGRLELVNSANHELWGMHPFSQRVEDYDHWKGWWADGSERSGQRIQAHEWGLARALRGEPVPGDTIEIEAFDRPGVRKSVLLRAATVRNADGTITGAVVAQMDLSERVRMEAELRQEEAKFRTITDAMPQMVWSCRADGWHDYFNQQWHAFTGQQPGATDGQGWDHLVHPDDRQRAREQWRHCLATGTCYEHEHRLRHHSGEYRWVLARALPVRDEHGGLLRWMGTCTDMHEQKLAQVALQKSEDSLKQADRRKDEFLAMLAHELRNPLAPISTASELLRISIGDDRRVCKASEIISRQVRHMTDLVNDLLDVSRVTRGLVKLSVEPLDVRECVRAAIEQVRPLLQSRGHSLATELWPQPLWVLGDRTRLVQVISNILANAAKYTMDGGRIVLRAAPHEDRVRVEVEDNGTGIEPNLLPHIFDLFTQAERTPDRSQGGLGIGLALVKSLVTLHGGEVAARSEGRGHGSVFSMTFPQGQPPREAMHSGEPPATVAAPAAQRIVLVDDNQDAAQTLATLLQAHGHHVRTFHSAEAVLAAQDLAADTFILDIGLPGLTGIELARRLRPSTRTGARFFALSGYGQEQDRAASRAAGFDQHFVKPVQSAALLAALERPGSNP
ncbi:MAG: sensor hybrid histidine kinase [Ramlibacter sp.]|nr:sensor hybrid histidine kinase [Ramlibacter sp.]